MPAFHQMGHDSENLLFEDGLNRFAGAILSPLNYTPPDVKSQLERLKDRPGFVTIFDPHLYRPQSERMCLTDWDYYPKDVETADMNEAWWAGIVERVAQTATTLGTTAVTSPAIVPKSFPDDFFFAVGRKRRPARSCASRWASTADANCRCEFGRPVFP